MIPSIKPVKKFLDEGILARGEDRSFVKQRYRVRALTKGGGGTAKTPWETGRGFER